MGRGSSGSHDLVCILVNCRSLKNKTAEFNSLIEISKPHIVIGTESWLDGTINDGEMFPSYYSVYRKDRNSRGGGVFILVHDSIVSQPMHFETESCEAVWCKVLLKNGVSVAVGSFYRPPGLRTPEPLFQLSNMLLSLQTSYVVLGGDFNLPDVEWQSSKPILRNTSLLYSAFYEMINAHSLSQLVETPTRISASSATLLDLFFCNDPSLVSSVLTIPGISDHDIVIANVTCTVKNHRPTEPRKVFSYDKGNYSSLSRALDAFLPEFQQHSLSLGMNEQWNLFKTKILSLTQTFIPSRIISAKRRTDKPWLNKELRSLINRKNRLFRKYCKLPQPELRSKIKKMTKAVTKEMTKAHETYLNSLGEKLKTNPKLMWKYVKNKNNSKASIPDVMDGIDYTGNTRGKAESFNVYFQSVFNRQTYPNTMPQILNPLAPMQEIVISEAGIVSLLEKLDVHSASGPDGISNFILKHCAASIAPFLTLLFQAALRLGVLPADWKNANVNPIFKSGDKTNFSNYRPISLTSVCSKILEHIIYTNLMTHLQNNNFFSPMQHGFRAGFSCDTQLIEFGHDIATSINAGTQVDCIFLDFRKAFDSVPHPLLLRKLSVLNIPTELLKWLDAYLFERKQCVVLEGLSSSSISVLSGVPQGSVLGPLLFLIFINDLLNCTSSRTRLYADDCCIYRDITSVADADLLQRDLNSVFSWCQSWGMTLNLTKCNLVRFTNKKHPLLVDYYMGGACLPVATEFKYLGIFFSSNLSWNHHVNYMIVKASRVLNFLRRNFRQAPTKVRETLYLTNVRPILEYGCSVWDPYTKTNVDALERIQARAARFVTGDYDFFKRSADICRRLGWPLLAERRKYLRLSLFYNIFNSRTGIKKETYLKQPTYVSPRTDHCLKIRELNSRINTFKYSFFPKTIHDWNALPEEIVCSSPSCFGKRLQDYMRQ